MGALVHSVMALSRVVQQPTSQSISQGCGAYGEDEGEHKRTGTCTPTSPKVQAERYRGPPPNELPRIVAPETAERPMADLGSD